MKSKKVFSASKYAPSLDLGFCLFKRLPHPFFCFGIVVTKKIGSAVVRNRIKRRIKGALREAIYDVGQPKELAIVAIARKDSIVSNFSKMVSSIKSVISSSDNHSRG